MAIELERTRIRTVGILFHLCVRTANLLIRENFNKQIAGKSVAKD